MWDWLNKIVIVLTIVTAVITIILFAEQSKTFSWVTGMFSVIVSPSLLKLVLATLILLLLSIGFWRQRILKEQLEDHSSGLKAMEQKLTQVLSEKNGSLYVRELITSAHLEENAIVLTHFPIPNTVHLFITSMIYVPETSRGMVLKGRKIFLEDIPGDVAFATNIRQDVNERSVAVEYLRDLSAEKTRN